MKYEIIDQIEQVEVIATGKAIRELRRLNKIYGKGHWRKLKGITTVRFEDGSVCKADVHWYEAHGIGKNGFKIKQIF